jgi:hypothetical protein
MQSFRNPKNQIFKDFPIHIVGLYNKCRKFFGAYLFYPLDIIYFNLFSLQMNRFYS